MRGIRSPFSSPAPARRGRVRLNGPPLIIRSVAPPVPDPVARGQLSLAADKTFGADLNNPVVGQ